jgi:Mg-chelatase subunit ChlD
MATVVPPATTSLATSGAQQPGIATQRPRVELVFALDTTSSMSGLIEGAKRKIWSLASFVAQGQPTPDLRVGLVAYRERRTIRRLAKV